MFTMRFTCRYASVSKARLAESHGAAAVILYSDPADVAPLGPSETYPTTVYAPPGATQLGSLRMQGDLLTPGYPAVGKSKYCKIAQGHHLPITVSILFQKVTNLL